MGVFSHGFDKLIQFFCNTLPLLPYYIYESFRKADAGIISLHQVTFQKRGIEVENRQNRTEEMRLVSEAQSGSKESFCALYSRYKDKLYRYALYRLNNSADAEDAVSECVLAAWQGLPRLKSTEAFGSWLFCILRRCCAKRINESVNLRENIQHIYESGNGSSNVSSGHSPSVSVELAEALSLLNDEEREIVLLSVLGDLTSREISEIIPLTPGAVRSKLSRSLARMREFLS